VSNPIALSQLQSLVPEGDESIWIVETNAGKAVASKLGMIGDLLFNELVATALSKEFPNGLPDTAVIAARIILSLKGCYAVCFVGDGAATVASDGKGGLVFSEPVAWLNTGTAANKATFEAILASILFPAGS
jgi:hypothetical protein